MHIAFLTIPSTGEFNVQFATAQELVAVGHQVTFLSGASLHKHVERLKTRVMKIHGGDEKKSLLIEFVSLGSQRSVEDFTPVVQERIHEMRQAPGSPTSIETCINLAMVSPEEHASTAMFIRDTLHRLNPDMIVVDVLSPAMLTGVRLSKRKFLLTIPCSPGMTALPSFFEPHPIAGNRRGSWPTLIENTYLRTRELFYCASKSDMRAKRSLLTDTFQLKSFGMSQDLTLLPPYWDDPECLGGIHFNTFALTDCAQQPASVVFVGAGVVEEESRPLTPTPRAEELAWMDEALEAGDSVVYINMGSMFIWTASEYQALLHALEDVYDMTGRRTRFLFKTNRPIRASSQPDSAIYSPADLPSYVKMTNWIDDQHAVYRHPALKVFVHHGGGNSFNEAVYFGIPQLVLSQWLDTHEYGSLAATFGIGLRSSNPPHIKSIDVRDKLLDLLGEKWAGYKSKASVWSLRSKLGGGAKAAAKVIECHATNQMNEKAAMGLMKVEMRGVPLVEVA